MIKRAPFSRLRFVSLVARHWSSSWTKSHLKLAPFNGSGAVNETTSQYLRSSEIVVLEGAGYANDISWTGADLLCGLPLGCRHDRDFLDGGACRRHAKAEVTGGCLEEIDRAGSFIQVDIRRQDRRAFSSSTSLTKARRCLPTYRKGRSPRSIRSTTSGREIPRMGEISAR